VFLLVQKLFYEYIVSKIIFSTITNALKKMTLSKRCLNII
jgi:hypothetical protein